ncbi:dissimilatory-type sulfite reductase subunit alpha [Desulfitobacterium hafniense]|uniref:Sulfite reductase dissimilatory-type alpha subunit n=5 Tax=root TaxID=1 RepID=Q251E4_DESHY|nr:dissimilatory-type sulfite reductase subunit alpha [Desulfitobacterium hafniense]ACL18320.1 sulfite reductase, dissimilatory-type alpha subunit [Desulfitobacterium hafniense DCB-2]EHL08071.1 sulfite reductase, dissimilatory-type alpha subunit [Desulfitobacterium hafniense DP7]KTE91531.1 sulfite reductase, dissimilatory-type subunit alpha [Desulfitobacterium hafniense]MEA5025827.1 dissimilatory-type sulfite reductase subunit alpha [Desulfitobacterium hafniense]BAE82098.1 sulfite reductase di
MAEKRTPQLDELEKGQWPSFVTEIKKAAVKNEASKELLHLLERSYEEKRGHWKHGGIVGVKGYGGGVIGRYTDLPEDYPNLAAFHTVRINSPSGWFYNTKSLRTICDIWEKRGSGLMNFHGATGDAILLGTTTDQLQPIFDELSEGGFDLGGSGSDLRSPSCCVGPGRCEHACYDTLEACYNITNQYQDELHRPMWPYKFKIKFSGCANDCTAAIARSDCAVIGTWRDTLTIDQEAVKAYVAEGLNIQAVVCDRCPTKCLKFDAETQELSVIAEECTRCMHCINRMPKAIAPGKERGATILLGGKSTIVQSAFMGWVIVPFMKMEVEDDFQEFKDMIERIWEWWDENGKTRERIGETIYRLGMTNFLTSVGLPAVPQMVYRPRANPYVFWPEDEIKK